MFGGGISMHSQLHLYAKMLLGPQNQSDVHVQHDLGQSWDSLLPAIRHLNIMIQ